MNFISYLNVLTFRKKATKQYCDIFFNVFLLGYISEIDILTEM